MLSVQADYGCEIREANRYSWYIKRLITDRILKIRERKMTKFSSLDNHENHEKPAGKKKKKKPSPKYFKNIIQ